MEQQKKDAIVPAKTGTATVSPLAVMAARFNIEPNKLMPVLKNTVIRGAGGREAQDAEVAAFVIVANEYGLNPFTKEIYAFASKGAVVPIVGVDGWAKLVNRQAKFDGCEFEEVTDDNGKPVKTTCKMFVQGRTHPIAVTEWFSECYRKTEPWDQMPHRMLRHKAFIQAGRICFGLAGIYDEDEARDIITRKEVVIEDIREPEELPPQPNTPPALEQPQPAKEQVIIGVVKSVDELPPKKKGATGNSGYTIELANGQKHTTHDREIAEAAVVALNDGQIVNLTLDGEGLVVGIE
jgi:phage recombination protein Bet